ncbi:hypothetical protein BUALT_Bualt12G0128500 [Buddleja alternifolia]|uniref:adenylate dimethylallyltransferase (ADP/ATP-dependent) n=1 Tax=Buddleja alternifolia TaxID=168488 RepID=A0AAV6X1D6_9LAMI|nr:hypothetical protein BUALT_Bualt12G0128500 [Buddleja alternifolia]
MTITFFANKQEGLMINKDHLINPQLRHKDKVVVVMGATGTGKTLLSIDLATRFNGEIINSDKIQVYKGLNIVTNKVTDEESRGVPHHLLGIVDPEADFTVHDFVHHALLACDVITRRGRLPIISGGSNSYIKALVIDDVGFRSKYDCCFLWVDVSIPVLHAYVSRRVDEMVDYGLVEEVKDFFDPKGDYTHGIRRAIGVPEMDDFFRNECMVDGEARVKLLEACIVHIKENTCKLACRQLQNILRLGELLEWRIHRLNATEAFVKCGVEATEAWERLVVRPTTRMLVHFLAKHHKDWCQPSPCRIP